MDLSYASGIIWISFNKYKRVDEREFEARNLGLWNDLSCCRQESFGLKFTISFIGFLFELLDELEL